MVKLIEAHYILLNNLIRSLQYVLFNKVNISKKNRLKRILILRNGSLGDSICALPAIENIRRNFPFSEIDILTNNGGYSLVSINNIIDNKLINHFINYNGIDKYSLTKSIKDNNYDLFIELPQDQASLISIIRNIVIVKLVFKIPHAFGWEIGSTRFLKKKQEKYIDFISERKRLLNILERNNLTVYGEKFPLNITEEDNLIVSDLISKYNLHNRNIAFVVGAKRNTNRWPIEYFKEVAEYFNKKGYCNIIIGGAEDKELVKKLLDIPNTFDFTGILTPMQSARMLQCCILTIANDTGPMHLSYAVGTPVVSIFSARDYPNKWFPPDSNLAFRDNRIECSVCFIESCSDNKCMKSIVPKTIINAVEHILSPKG